MTKRVFLTGGGGFLGRAVVRRLIGAGATVLFVDTKPSAPSYATETPNLTSRICDVTGRQAVTSLLDDFRPDVIVHLAALLIPPSNADPYLAGEVNLLATVTMFEEARKRGIGIVYASSEAAQTRTAEGALTTFYGCFKYCCEEVARSYGALRQVDSFGIRPGVVFGVDRAGADGGLTGAVSRAMVAAARGEPYEIPFAGYYRFETLDEVVDVFARVALSEFKGARISDISEKEYSIPELVDVVRSLIPDASISCVGNDASRILTSHGNLELRQLLGTWHSLSLQEGISELIRDVRSR